MENEVFLKLSKRDRDMTTLADYLMFASSILQSFAIPVALPKLYEYYGLVPYQAFVLAASSVVSTILTLFGGKFSEKRGRKTIVLINTYLRTIMLLLIALKPSSTALFVTCYLLKSAADGFGGATYAAIVGDIYSKEDRPKIMGIMGTINGGAMVLGIFGGGILVDYFGPFSIYWVIFAVTLPSAVLFTVYFKNKVSDSEAKADVWGIALVSVALICSTIWSNFGGRDFDKFGGTGIALLAGFLVFVVLFLIKESKSDDGILPVSFFKNRFFLSSCITTFCIRPMANLCGTNLSLFAQQGLGLSATVAGTLALPKNLVFTIVPTFLGLWLAKSRKRYGAIMLLCGGGIALGSLIVCFVNANTPLMLLYIGMFIIGFGTSAQSNFTHSYMQLSVDDKHRGTATAGINFCASLGNVLVNTVYSLTYTLKYNQLIPTGAGSMTEVSEFSFHALAIVSTVCALVIVAARFITYVDPTTLDSKK